MRVLMALLLLLSLSFAQCIDNGICEPAEKSLGCSDCSFGNVCVDDGVCTNVEFAAGECQDCSSTPKTVAPVEAADPRPGTGFLILVGGVVVIGFLVLFAAAVVVGFSVLKKGKRNRRIRL